MSHGRPDPSAARRSGAGSHECVSSSAARGRRRPARGRIREHGERSGARRRVHWPRARRERTRGCQWTPRRRRRRSDACEHLRGSNAPSSPCSIAGSIAGHAATIPRLPSPVAQLAEHPAVNRRVVGSSPTRGVKKGPGNRVFLMGAVRRDVRRLAANLRLVDPCPLGRWSRDHRSLATALGQFERAGTWAAMFFLVSLLASCSRGTTQKDIRERLNSISRGDDEGALRAIAGPRSLSAQRGKCRWDPGLAGPRRALATFA